MIVDLDIIYTKLSNKYGVSKLQIEIACRTMFELVRNTMREQTKENIATPFGKFVVPDRKKYGKVLDDNRGMEEIPDS